MDVRCGPIADRSSRLRSQVNTFLRGVPSEKRVPTESVLTSCLMDSAMIRIVMGHPLGLPIIERFDWETAGIGSVHLMTGSDDLRNRQLTM